MDSDATLILSTQ